MDISKYNLVVFSPTGGTIKVAQHIALELSGQTSFETLDITVNDCAVKDKRFVTDELTIVAYPVYGGRIPAPMAERMIALKAENAPAVMVTVFGNRAFDDALLEGKNILTTAGFNVVAAGAFIAEHSVIREFGAGRPDEQDKAAEKVFAEQVAGKLKAASDLAALSMVSVPGNDYYMKYGGIPLKPKAGRKCIGCGLCAKNCPTGAISLTEPKATDKTKCISCMRCINICPHEARKQSPTVMVPMAKLLMKKFCSTRKEPKIYL